MLLNKKKIIVLKLLFVLYIFIPVIFWSTYGFFDPYSIGQLFGLLNIALLSLMPLLSSRFHPLEKGVGQDRLLRWHSNIAKTAFVLILLHPALIIGRYLLERLSIFEIAEFYNSIGYWLGYVMLISLIITIVTSIYTRKIRLNYEVWKIIHYLNYVILIGMFIHSFFLGTHTQEGEPLYYWWLGLMIIVAFGMFNRLVMIPLKRKKYEVVKIENETEEVISVYMKPLEERINFSPGQFAYARFYSLNISSEEHHFTLSGSPNDKYLRYSIKSVGDYTKDISKIKVGDKVGIDGPYGAFSNEGMSGPFLFIAGGIGVTPLMSMILAMRDQPEKEKVILMYSAGSFNEMAFKKELEKLSKEDWFEVQFFDRRLEEEDLKKALTTIKAPPKVFLVGPEPMMDSIEKMLVSLKIPSSNIFTEKFRLK